MAPPGYTARQRALMPGGRHDFRVGILKTVLPVASAIVILTLVVLPLISRQEFSFLLSKNSAEVAGERMQVEDATYRGRTGAGEPFVVHASSALQKSSSVPVVLLRGLSAEITQEEGPARISAPSGEFMIDDNRVVVDGPVKAESASGYQLEGKRIVIDIGSKRVVSSDPVSGVLPSGTFRANSFLADFSGGRVVLEGDAQLRFRQKAASAKVKG